MPMQPDPWKWVRNSDGNIPMPLPTRIDGGYPLIYYATESDGVTPTTDIVCAQCATMVSTEAGWSWIVWGCDPYYVGPTEQCTHCLKEITSAYGDPDEGQ